MHGRTSTGWSRPRFVVAAGTRRLPDVPRYVRGIEYRLDRLAEDVARDLRRMAEVVPLEERLRAPFAPETSDWKLEELRVVRSSPSRSAPRARSAPSASPASSAALHPSV